MDEKKIVIVLEEDAELRALLRDQLLSCGYAVRLHKTVRKFFEQGPPSHICCLVVGQHFKGGGSARDVQVEVKRRGWSLPCIVLSTDWSVRSVVDTLRAGAEGYITKPIDPEQFMYEVERALGKCRVRLEANQGMLDLKRRAAKLSLREQRIVALVVAGYLNKEVADQLNLAVVTIKVYRARAMKILGAGNAAELAHLAVWAGIAEDTYLSGSRRLILGEKA